MTTSSGGKALHARRRIPVILSMLILTTAVSLERRSQRFIAKLNIEITVIADSMLLMLS